MTFRFLNPDETSQVRQSINADREFRLASRHFSKDILLTAGAASCLVKIRDGAVVGIEHQPSFMKPWSFCIKGASEAWENFLQPLPPPT